MNDSYSDSLAKLQGSGRLRNLKPLVGRHGCRIVYNGREMLNLSSNDYLGLAGDMRLHQKFYSQLSKNNLLDDFGLGSASSRLLTGDSIHAHELEETLRNAYRKDGCLLFNSGYHANIGILPALLGKNDLILSDKLNHASIVDGMRLCNAQHKRYRHCDYGHLAELLREHRSAFNRVVIVSESVFSMDGDVADLSQLVALKEQYDCLLYLDEAHAIGLYGASGLGMAEEQCQLAGIDLLVGTFGKALASVGAFLLCSAVIRDYLINHSRSLIFTTALPPVVLSWNHFIFREMLAAAVKGMILRRSQQPFGKVFVIITWLPGDRQYVPVMLGDDTLAGELAVAMQDKGYLIFPVRPPTVPEKTSRFRISLTANMLWADLAAIGSEIAQLIQRFHK